MLILVIEDDPVIGKSIAKCFSEAGHECEWVKNGAHGLAEIRAQKFDIVVLDLTLPDESGWIILATVRGEGIQTPILALSALGKVEDIVRGLKLGADDCLAKPFALAELHARLHAVWRRARAKPAPALRSADLHLDLAARRINAKDTRIDLTPSEFTILELLMRHAGSVVTRKMLCECLGHADWDGSTNVIDVHINRLRCKLEKFRKERLIRTVRGHGYALEWDEEP